MRGIAAGLAVGGCLTWNVTNVGAVADPLAGAYDISLAEVGLLTTALFVSHLVVQLPAGRRADLRGARAVALLAIGATIAGNALLLVDDSFPLALAGRAVVGLGSGAAFVAGLDLVRVGGGEAVARGLYGGATMAGGGLALMIVPPLTEETGWRAPYWSAMALAFVAALPVLAARGLPQVGHAAGGVVRDRGLLVLGALQAATFGLAVIAGNWAVPLLERQGASAEAAGLAAGLILFGGLATRPAGGWLAASGRRRRIVALALAGVTTGSVALAVGGPFWLSVAGALVFGLSAGLPFAIVFAAAQRLRGDAPAAAVATVNGLGVLAILVGTPLAGLAFESPGGGEVAFAAIAAIAAVTAIGLRRAPL